MRREAGANNQEVNSEEDSDEESEDENEEEKDEEDNEEYYKLGTTSGSKLVDK